jgi:hypothetical protein
MFSDEELHDYPRDGVIAETAYGLASEYGEARVNKSSSVQVERSIRGIMMVLQGGGAADNVVCDLSVIADDWCMNGEQFWDTWRSTAAALCWVFFFTGFFVTLFTPKKPILACSLDYWLIILGVVFEMVDIILDFQQATRTMAEPRVTWVFRVATFLTIIAVVILH